MEAIAMTQDLWNTAERLRAVRSARQKFLTMWALDQAHRHLEQQWKLRGKRVRDSRDSDVQHPNWKALYRGSVLDD